MNARKLLRVVWVVVVLAVATTGFHALRTQAASGGRHCDRGVKACTASQVGQPCNPNNLNIICAAQTNGSYCCLASAR